MRAVKTLLLLLSAAIVAAGFGIRAPISESGQEGRVERQTPRNIVFVVADDHGQDTGAYGNAVIQTPHLDALAAEGVRFRYAFATTASCSASRSVILTGLHNHRTGQFGHEHDYHHFVSFPNLRSLPVLLSEAGYRTAIVGKFHVAPEAVYQFQLTIPGDQRNAVQMAESARAFIAANPEQPFFLYYATSDPHRGGGFAEELPHSPDRFGNRPQGYEGVVEVRYDPDEVIVPPWLPDTPATRAELAQYYQSVSRLDQGVGRLVRILKEEGVNDNTLFVYASDHGAAFAGAKTTVYEPGLRSPLIVRHPSGTRRGIVNSAMVSWVDLTPTLLDFADVAPPTYTPHIGRQDIRSRLEPEHGLHGRSFLDVLEDEDPEGWDVIYASHTFHEIQMYYPMRVIRDRRYKLIWNIAHPLPYPFASDLWASPTWQSAHSRGPDPAYGLRSVRSYIHRPAFELYDIERDPHESRNLAADPAYADVLREYQQRLKAFRQRTFDPWLLKWTYE
jgi:N-sulfoglucosamine sulfohydrolase